MTRTAIYPGSFDPLTLGHANIIERGLRLFDHVIVAIAVNVNKTPLFSFEERSDQINETFPTGRVEVASFEGLLVEYAGARGCSAILRGIRSVKDFEYEQQMAVMNAHLAPEIETIFLMSEPGLGHISSSLIKEVARFGGAIDAHVPPHIAQALRARLSTP